ncbi:MAG: hypothetical protein ACK53Y_27455, partial [bacterium]
IGIAMGSGTAVAKVYSYVFLHEQLAFKIRSDLSKASTEHNCGYFNISVMRHQQQRNMHSTMMVATVDELHRNYTAREMKQMDEARRLYVIMGRPSKADFLKMIKRGTLLENPVRMEDFYNAEKVFGKDLGVVKGKTVRVRPNRVVVDTETAALEKLNII